MAEPNHTANAPSAVESTAAVENPAHPVIANDDADFIDADDDSLASSTTSIADSIRGYRLENGRTYHKYKDGSKFILVHT
ncbi:uncharacterized protein ColSpa_06170 [Colletotrichum spaethianum]|uniref:Uncharacterized protein n=1 Tax=Colletotrichum spaethianum TaxID=700344 RepID=A0AA37LGL8_9PEZI|nr:uncharacterized protein ColSpa_06170 [Colletotrichum spaethianum]GKT45989.1 hypothetical protein ColSpa_06170 [Colletotrichum spaethianum]